MLENKKAVFETDKVIAFRIVSGEEIIGKITHFDAQSVSIKKPCTLTIDPNTGGMGLMPASFIGNPEEDVIYQRTAITAVMTPREDAVSSYEAYASNLVLPKKEGIVTSAK
jgi:hypothetical protein